MARGIASAVFVVCAALTARGENRLWTEATSGEPGQFVTVTVRATNDVSIRGIDVMVGFDTAAFTYVDTSFEGSALAGLAVELGQIDWSAYGAVCVRSYVYYDYGTPFPATTNWEFARVRFRIRSAAAQGDRGCGVVRSIPEKPASTALMVAGGTTPPVTIVPGTVYVQAATHPAPPDSLACRQDLQNVQLTWQNPRAYDRITVVRDGVSLAALDGAAEAYTDPSPPQGPREYSVTGTVGAEATLPVVCAVAVGPPVVEAVKSLACIDVEGGAALSWELPRDYTAIAVLRNGEALATLDGAATSYADSALPPGAVFYEVVGYVNAVASAARSCVVNGTFVFRLGSARVAPEGGIAEVPLFISSPLSWNGFSFGVASGVPGVTLEGAMAMGTSLEPIWPFYLVARTQANWAGGIVGVSLFDSSGVVDRPPAVETCALILKFSVGQLPAGTVVPLRFDATIGSPPADVVLAVQTPKGVYTRPPEPIDGEIVVGDPALAPVKDLKLARAKGDGVVLSWRNAAAYDGIEVERNGVVLRTLEGDARSAADTFSGAGAYWYRVRGVAGGTVSPWSLVIHTELAGATFFRRGDVNLDAIVNLADAVTICSYLFKGRVVGCLDALDTNDDGRLNVADPVYLLAYLFAKKLPPPTPGPELRWFDPTPDDLDCAVGAP